MTDRSPEDKRYYFYRDQLVALGIGFAITSLIIFVLGVMTGRHLERGATVESTSSGVKIPLPPPQPAAAPEGQRGETPSDRETVARDGAKESSDTKPAKESKAKEKIAKAETPKATLPVKQPAKSVRQPSQTESSADEKSSPAPRQEQGQKTEVVKKDSAEQVWTVQVKSSPEKKYATTWAERLKAKGYDAFVVEGAVKGQTWYRVRVGHFAARQEAEALRTALESQEGLSGGFLTLTKTADTGSKSE
ncbi:MAG: SPOR domain-containing protein [Alphaproteobacteria bacterium]